MWNYARCRVYYNSNQHEICRERREKEVLEEECEMECCQGLDAVWDVWTTWRKLVTVIKENEVAQTSNKIPHFNLKKVTPSRQIHSRRRCLASCSLKRMQQRLDKHKRINEHEKRQQASEEQILEATVGKWIYRLVVGQGFSQYC